MSIGSKIRRLREDKQISQIELAGILDIEQTTLSRIESDKTEKLDVFMMDKICQFFDKDFAYFLTEKGDTYNFDNNKGVVMNSKRVTINNFPQELVDLVKEILQNHQKQTNKIKELEKRIKI